ncbi:calcium-binding protein [Erythrobacter sp. SAORIC-644]|uniref:calcium-binding protein n=1 Tax=Erythrobacter sp. SAORIC-644 TaxID=1869314 RepID=UPI001F3AA89E|nr:hypothetical protein [Erythrobacter sp. SAORIC-644]
MASSDDTVTAGALGYDTVDYSGADSGINWSAVGVQISQVEEVIGTDFADDFQLFTSVAGSYAGFESNVLIRGAGGNDLIRGNGGQNKLYGDEGDDRIWGGSGDDTIDGGAGDDRIFGDSTGFLTPDGDDTISGGSGDDYIDGQGGTV